MFGAHSSDSNLRFDSFSDLQYRWYLEQAGEAVAERYLQALVSDWTLLPGLTEGYPGHFQFTDPQAASNPKRFYRVRSP